MKNTKSSRANLARSSHHDGTTTTQKNNRAPERSTRKSGRLMTMMTNNIFYYTNALLFLAATMTMTTNAETTTIAPSLVHGGAARAAQQQEPAFTCEVCGCSYCPPGFVLKNPSGVIPIPPEMQEQAPPGFTEVPCGLLDFAGTEGHILAEVCTDEWRLDPVFRANCGCPDLPPAPTAAPSSSARPTISAPPSGAPSTSARPTTSTRPTTTPVPMDPFGGGEVTTGGGYYDSALNLVGLVLFVVLFGIGCLFVCLCPLLCIRHLAAPNGDTVGTGGGTETPNNHNNVVVPSIYWQEGTTAPDNEHFDYKTSQEYLLQQAQANRWKSLEKIEPGTPTTTTTTA
jgi:hypothetical protein